MKAKKFYSILAIVLVSIIEVLSIVGIIVYAGKKDDSRALTINFESNGGASVEAVKYISGKLQMPASPVKSDYLFGGWYLDNETFENEFDSENASKYADKHEITLYAKWLKKVNLVFVEFDEIEDLYLDSLDKTLPTPQKDGFEFVGWYLDNGLLNEYTISRVVEPNENNEVYLFAKWKNASNIDKTIYYKCNLAGIELGKEEDIVPANESIILYQPKVNFYAFEGWYFDKEFTKLVPTKLQNDMLSAENTVIYAKFTLKDIDFAEILGHPKEHYEYGEEFDANGAKVLVHYKNGYEDELIDLTADMLFEFTTTGHIRNGGITSSNSITFSDGSTSEDYDFSHEAYINLTLSTNNSTVIYSQYLTNLSISYSVNSDIKSFTINEENLNFLFNESPSLERKNIVVSWTNKNEESGTEKLTDNADFGYNYGYGSNYLVSNLDTQRSGTRELSLRYHLKTIKCSYTVADCELDGGYVLSNEGTFIKGYSYSLINNKVYLHSVEDDAYILLENLKEDDIIIDIDTTNSGERCAKILYNGKVLDIKYYVLDLEDIVSIELANKYFTHSDYNYTLFSYRIKVTLKDGTILEYNFTTNKNFVIEEFDIKEVGEKSLKAYFYGREFVISYVVV